MNRIFRSNGWRGREFIRAGVVLAICAALPGCEGLWKGWNDFWGFNQPPKIVKTSNPMETPQGGNTIVEAAPLPKVHLFRMSLPVGTVSGNEKIWRQLDEDALDSQTSVMMAQNGLRAGVAPISRWPALSKMLDVTGAGKQEFFCQTDGRSSLNLVVRENVNFQIIVSVDRDNQQQGRTFEKCVNAFRLSMSLLKDKSNLMVQLEPVVMMAGATGTAQPVTTDEAFLDVRLWTTIKQDQFLMVAPAPTRNRYSIGTRFLSDSDKAPATETVLVFVPVLDEKKEK